MVLPVDAVSEALSGQAGSSRGRSGGRLAAKKGQRGEANAAAAAAWERVVACLPAAEQVKAVSMRLKRLNPGFDGKFGATIANKQVIGLTFTPDLVTDISAVHVLIDLRALAIEGSGRAKALSLDLTPP